VKISQNTYNVFGGTLNLAQPAQKVLGDATFLTHTVHVGPKRLHL